MAKSAIQVLAEKAGLTVRSYSGRGMFGKDCLAISGKDEAEIYSELFLATADKTFSSADLILIGQELQTACIDNMGKGVVLYFLTVKFEEEGK